ncbi:MAG: SGNH/GDSL hydrolase family protein [Lentisphaerae bacterium]|nr:SGNH/GDSL hydrolase family protein [Lentisphaerota bacterium]
MNKLVQRLFMLAGLVGLLLIGLMIWRGTSHLRPGLGATLIASGAALSFALAYCARHEWRMSSIAWPVLIGKLVLGGISLAVSLAVAEVALRVILRNSQSESGSSLSALQEIEDGKVINTKTFHPLAAIVRLSRNKKLVYELMPNLDMVFGNKSLRTNDRCMRDDHDYSEAKPAGVVRVVGIGDSGMFGWDVEQGEDYMNVLETNLNRRSDARYEVLNFGIPGYNTQQEVEMLKDRGLAFAPDIVVVGWCDNDYGVPFFLLQPKTFDRKDISYLRELLFNRSNFWNEAQQEVELFTEVPPDLVDPSVIAGTEEEGVTLAFQALMAMAQEHHFKVVVFGPMNAIAVGLCQQVGVPYYNLWDEIPVGTYPEAYNIYFMHPPATGHSVLAKHLEAYFEQQGWLPGAAVSD